MKKLIKGTLGLGLLGAGAYAVWRAYQKQTINSGMEWEPQPFPYPPRPAEDSESSWVKPKGKKCPNGFPVKANSKTKVFRTPEHNSYADTTFVRCYQDTEFAEADGYHAAKR